jgi:cellulose synthase/poly-beta-1,6-N-acetylglucosamine synthase-like glycosyltransferase
MKFIRGLLESIILQDVADLNVEVIIADGMSDDGTRQILDKYSRIFPALRVIDNPGKIASTGLNAAIRVARGEVIIRMDAHSDYAPDYIRTCVRVLKETGADNVGGPALTRANGYLAQAIALAFHTEFACGGAKFHDSQYEGYADTVPYGCWRRSTLDRIGLFDESFHRNQDDELNLRLIAAGGKIWQSPKIVSWYWPRPTLPAVARQYFQYGFWKVAVIRKHGRPASRRHLVPGASLACAMALVLGIVGGRLSGARQVSLTFIIVSAVLAGMYFAASICAALLAAKRNGWRFLPILPLVFITYHASYGLGFLSGLWRRPASNGMPYTSAQPSRGKDSLIDSSTHWRPPALKQEPTSGLECAREAK